MLFILYTECKLYERLLFFFISFFKFYFLVKLSDSIGACGTDKLTDLYCFNGAAELLVGLSGHCGRACSVTATALGHDTQKLT